MRHVPSGLALLALFLVVGSGTTWPGDAPPDGQLQVTVRWDEPHQAIRGFGASGAWSTQFVGTWPSAKKNKIADWLFSQQKGPEGRPEGIGLSIWRFNVGAGSAEQGAASGIRSEWRRAEGFLTEIRDGELVFDWSRQKGQRWFARAARERGVSTLIAFANSPPVELTENGKAFGDGSGTANLPDDRFDDFARFLATVTEHFEDDLSFDYVSPVNEPQWNWSQDDNQEGSPYTNAEFRRIVKALNRALAARDLSAKIEIPETAQIDYLYSADTDRPRRDNQIATFFGEEHALQNRSHVALEVAAHSYFTTWPISDMIQQRERVARQMQATDPSLEYWMSEYCVLAGNEEIKGPGRDLGIDPALYVARVIHADLTIANASSWQWWLGVSPGDFKDGLVYVDRGTKALHDSKLLWGLGNYSYFLRPGAVRVGIHRSDEASRLERMRDGVMVSAYRSADGERAVVVAVNQNRQSRTMRLQVEGRPRTEAPQMWQPYVTSSTDDLAPQPTVDRDSTLTVPPRSIVTFAEVP
jgi:O-glycosyl hydrolase